MRCLVVIAHPLPGSLTHALAAEAIRLLEAAGHEVVVEDLCATGFAPALTAAERGGYYAGAYDGSAVAGEAARLAAAEALVLVFPTWWFGFPAILKGWFDRVWAPGLAYDHGTPIRPRLAGLRHTLAVTTLGAPAFYDWLVMRRPVRRVLKHAIIGACARRSSFAMLSLYGAEAVTPARLARFKTRLAGALAGWR
jgi:putative NADPH-quinone reductase